MLRLVNGKILIKNDATAKSLRNRSFDAFNQCCQPNFNKTVGFEVSGNKLTKMTMNMPLSTAMENLSVALKNNIVPNQEYLLQGSVLDSAVEVLLHRLRGLCDNVDSGPETFHDHEMCFSIRSSTMPTPLSLRVRRALDCNDVPWQLRYIGQPELGPQGDKTRPTIVRSSIDIGTSSTIVEFLTELGCRMDFEYIVRGYMFRKGRMKITVSKIFKMGQVKPPESVEAISQSYLVELSVLAPSGQDAIAEDMRCFAEQLKPLVQLEKIDYKRLGTIGPHVP